MGSGIWEVIEAVLAEKRAMGGLAVAVMVEVVTAQVAWVEEATAEAAKAEPWRDKRRRPQKVLEPGGVQGRVSSNQIARL